MWRWEVSGGPISWTRLSHLRGSGLTPSRSTKTLSATRHETNMKSWDCETVRHSFLLLTERLSTEDPGYLFFYISLDSSTVNNNNHHDDDNVMCGISWKSKDFLIWNPCTSSRFSVFPPVALTGRSISAPASLRAAARLGPSPAAPWHPGNRSWSPSGGPDMLQPLAGTSEAPIHFWSARGRILGAEAETRVRPTSQTFIHILSKATVLEPEDLNCKHFLK